MPNQEDLPTLEQFSGLVKDNHLSFSKLVEPSCLTYISHFITIYAVGTILVMLITIVMLQSLPSREIIDFITHKGSLDSWIQVGQCKTVMMLLNYPVRNQCYLSKGWIELANDYNIVPGDVLIFDILKLDDPWMKTLIVKGVA